MAKVLSAFGSSQAISETETVVAAGDGPILNGLGETTAEYNDSDGDANSTTYIKTGLGRVNEAQVTIAVNDADLSTSAVGVEVADARPAEPSDFFEDDDFVPGTILFTLVDEDGSGEIAADTDITMGDLSFTYSAVRA